MASASTLVYGYFLTSVLLLRAKVLLAWGTVQNKSLLCVLCVTLTYPTVHEYFLFRVISFSSFRGWASNSSQDKYFYLIDLSFALIPTCSLLSQKTVHLYITTYTSLKLLLLLHCVVF